MAGTFAQRYLLIGIIRSQDQIAKTIRRRRKRRTTVGQWRKRHKNNNISSIFFTVWSVLVRMLCGRQKRVWRYVEKGKFLSLKSVLRKHRDLDVNFSQGKRERSPLHLACYLSDDAVLRLLLEHGADVLRKDHKGNTPLHVAVKRALKDGKTGKGDKKANSF